LNKCSLSKENKKFIYGVAKKGGRAKEFELAIQWLVDAGLVVRVGRVTMSARNLIPVAIHISFIIARRIVLWK